MAPEGDPTRVARALKHPLRALMLQEYVRATSSPSRIARRLGQPLNLVAYHSKVLERLGCIRLERVEPSRGESFYRAVSSPIIEDDAWREVPLKLRRGYIRTVLSLAADDAARSAIHGGFDRSTVHVSRTPLLLDADGTQALARLLRELLEDVAALERESAMRQAVRTRQELVIVSFDDVSPRVQD